MTTCSRRCVGLIKAAENFDTTRGVKFSTYAVPVILGEVRRLFFRRGAAVSRISRTWENALWKRRTASGRRPESPGVVEIAQRLEVSVEKAVGSWEGTSSCLPY